MEPIVIRKPSEEDLLHGWDGEGWYFSDEEGDLHGPFDTRQECAQGVRILLDDLYDDGGL